MLYPSLEEVQNLAETYNTIPVFFTIPADHRTPVSIFSALSAKEENAFLLESVNNGTQWDRYSFIGFHPEREFKANGAQLQIMENGNSQTVAEEKPFQYLQNLLDKVHSPKVERH